MRDRSGADHHLIVLQVLLRKLLRQLQGQLQRDLARRKGLNDVECLRALILSVVPRRLLHLGERCLRNTIQICGQDL